MDRHVAYMIAEFDNGDEPTGYVKVGKSTESQFQNRLSNLQTGNPRRLKTLLCYIVTNAFEVETIMDRLQQDKRIKLHSSRSNDLTPQGYPEKKTEWYKIDGRSVKKFMADFRKALEEARVLAN